MPAGSSLTYSAVVLHYRDPIAVTECLQALLAQTRPPIHVVIVDNGSTPGELEQLSSNSVQVLQESANVGYGAAMDDGRRAGRQADATLFLTQDCLLSAHAAAELAGAFEADESL